MTRGAIPAFIGLVVAGLFLIAGTFALIPAKALPLLPVAEVKA